MDFVRSFFFSFCRSKALFTVLWLGVWHQIKGALQIYTVGFWREMKAQDAWGTCAKLYVVWEPVSVLQAKHLSTLHAWTFTFILEKCILILSTELVSVPVTVAKMRTKVLTIPALKRDVVQVCAPPVKILKRRYPSFNFLLSLSWRIFR